MTDRQALNVIRKHVKSCGGNPRNVIKAKSDPCVPHKWAQPKSWSDKTCSHHSHPKDCPTGIVICRVEYLRIVPGMRRFGFPGFIEVIAELPTWEAVIAKVKSNLDWR
jgi:hypothetical protein